MRIFLPSRITPEPAASTGFCRAHGRTGLGSRITLVTRTIESSVPAARAVATAPRCQQGQTETQTDCSRVHGENLASLGLSWDRRVSATLISDTRSCSKPYTDAQKEAGRNLGARVVISLPRRGRNRSAQGNALGTLVWSAVAVLGKMAAVVE